MQRTCIDGPRAAGYGDPMKTMRLLALPAIAAAAVLTMTGCFQLPGAPTTNPGATPATSATPTDGGDPASSDLAGTSWTGSADVQPDVSFTLNADGTVDFDSWGGQSFDTAADVWSGDSSSVSITVTGISDQTTNDPAIDITFVGPATGGSMNLSGQGTDGQTYSMTMTQR